MPGDALGAGLAAVDGDAPDAGGTDAADEGFPLPHAVRATAAITAASTVAADRSTLTTGDLDTESPQAHRRYQIRGKNVRRYQKNQADRS
jgi:hypothetical protein